MPSLMITIGEGLPQLMILMERDVPPVVTAMEEDLPQILMSPLMIMTEEDIPIDDGDDANSSMVDLLLGHQSIKTVTVDEGRGDATLHGGSGRGDATIDDGYGKGGSSKDDGDIPRQS
jgi:hypothetical protein